MSLSMDSLFPMNLPSVPLLMKKNIAVKDEILECGQRSLHLSQVQVARNEDDPAAAVRVRPRPEVPRRVDDVLHTFQEQRPPRFPNVEEPLQPEDAVTVLMEQHGQPDTEHVPVEGPVELETAGDDPAAREVNGLRRCRISE